MLIGALTTTWKKIEKQKQKRKDGKCKCVNVLRKSRGVRLNHSFVEPPIRKLRQWGPLGLKPILWMEFIIRWVIMHCILRSWLKPQPYQQLMVFIQVLPWLGSSCCRSLVTTLPRNYAVSSREGVSSNLIILAFSFSKDSHWDLYLVQDKTVIYTGQTHASQPRSQGFHPPRKRRKALATRLARFRRAHDSKEKQWY